MAKQYKLAKGKVRTPEEHRKILAEIDAIQRAKSKKGCALSLKRMKNTFGVSSTEYKKSKKPKYTKPKIYDIDRYARK